MNIHVPYTNLRDDTKQALDLHAVARGHTVTYVDVSTDDEAYFRLWRDLWVSGDDFAIVEHDIVIHEGVLPEFEQCPQEWCTFGYEYTHLQTPDYHGTGCVRFRASLCERFPDVMEKVSCRSGSNHPERHWCSLDGFRQVELWDRGLTNHRHQPPVGHTDPAPSHGCLCTF